MPKGVAAKGTVFKLGTLSVGALTSIGGVAASADTIDVTALHSPDNYREFIGGFKDGGEVALDGYFYKSDAGQTAIFAAFESGAVTSCSIVFPAAISASWTFDGVVTAVETSADLEDALGFSATVKVSGKPTLA